MNLKLRSSAERVVLSWPNRITLGRLLLIPLFVVFVLQVRANPNWRYAAFAVFLITALGDALDGYLARRLNECTLIGQLLDPLADKLLLTTAFVLCSSPAWPLAERLPVWIPVVVITRDVFLIFGSALALLLNRSAKVCPTLLGKSTTAVQMATILAVLLGCHMPLLALQSMAWLTGVLTILSGVDYFYLGVRELT